MKHRPRRVRGLRLKLALAGIVAGTVLFGSGALPDTASTASAAEQEYRRGPAPTLASLQAEKGPFAYKTATVPSQSGFGGGTIYYPTDTSQGTFGAVAIAPGFTESQSAVAWFGSKLASNGFVVFTINVKNTWLDQPDYRGLQLLSALDYLTKNSVVRDQIDPNRLAVAGHSMGGGGALSAANARPSIQAAVPLTPWHTDKTWENLRVPTLIVGAENDGIASVSRHAEPLYESLTSAPERAYLELNDAGHMVSNSYNTTIGQYTLAWLKRYVDNDTRYEQFLCPPPSASTLISEYRSSCPGS
ncbi:alpha/beta hydrolase family protein [Streptomyces specialis]|uniref:alpha/beta hydrolase family protein n=1 Tax=Streptomyces specialis TaxID=498367 RepID=UPI00073E92BB|nr:acetylxylan esterase [Streptomyces specialis]